MRTIVVFHSPAEGAAEELWYCELDDLGGKPLKGDSVVYSHKVYEVSKTYVPLGSRDAQGGLRSGSDRFLELLNTLFGSQKALGLYARLRNIGSGDAPEVSTGGIVLARASLAGEFDNVIFCSVKEARSSGAAKGFPTLLQAVSRLHAGEPDAGDAPVRGRRRNAAARPKS